MRIFSLAAVALSCVFSTIQGLPFKPVVKSSERKSFLPTCSLCNLAVHGIFQSFEIGLTNEDIVDNIALICISRNLYDEEICRGVATDAIPTVRYIHNNSLADPGNICGILMQEANCTFSDREKLEWSIAPSLIPKPDIVQLDSPPSDASTIKVLHLADPHWDPEYLEGSNANCGKPLCCRASSGLVATTDDEAGYWGDYRKCDMPWRTLENAVKHMSKHHSDVAYIIWTGDLVPHDIWSTTREENMLIHESLLNLIKKYFPDTPIYPTLGNHDAHPANTFATPEITDQDLGAEWLYQDAARLWTKFGLPDEVSNTVRHGGYYTTLVRPGLRMVSLNTNYCYTFNWWTLTSTKDPASILSWLTKILEDAEAALEKVHIIAHIPPGNEDCWAIYSREFERIINRFESTVVAQFYGHTHNEEFKLFYDKGNATRPINVAFIAGSMTSFTDLSPSYRVYTIDGERPDSSWRVLDYSTWMMNLTLANLRGPTHLPEWFELYQAKKEYALTDLNPNTVDSFFSRMLDNDALFQLYFKNYHKAADKIISKGCDETCRETILCRLITSNIAERERCNQIDRKIFKDSVEAVAVAL
ncbi:sphingomyelin phosphodiesterase-like [Daphnia carinata]|uniref:sphingomyelin phosphodiesterase-like n=1 Tax=Daphnia carinata TaxID=120202 RepID=UPI0025796073|nr:sphingomyelin phosphodiesterase-like [Daphnia carinata]